MTIQHMDNFTPYAVGGQTRMLDGVWAEIGSFGSTALVEDPDPNVTGPVLAIAGAAGQSSIARLVLSAAKDVVGISTRFWLSRLPNTSGEAPHICDFRTIANSTMAYVSVTTTGALTAYVGGVLVGTTTGPVITANAWWHIETKVEFNGASSTLEVRVEGVTVLSLNITTPDLCAQVATTNVRGGAANDFRAYWKDFVVWDGDGAHNNDFMGSVSVVSLIPNSDTLTGWTPSTGTLHYPLVDNSPPDDATQYVTAINPPPAPDQYGLTNLPPDVTSVRGIMTFARARKTDGGDGNLQVSMVSGADTADGADRPITAAFVYWRDLFEEDPATDALWLPDAVDLADVKINRTL